MQTRSIDILWPYPPSAGRPVEQTDVVVELEDGTRWMSSFHDTHRFNQGVKGFRGLGANRPFRFGPRLVIVSELNEASVRTAVLALLESSHFSEAFERIADSAADQ